MFPAGHFCQQVEGRIGSQGNDVLEVAAFIRGLEVGGHEEVRFGRKQFQLKHGRDKETAFLIGLKLNCFRFKFSFWEGYTSENINTN